MSQENVEILRGLFEAWNRQDFESGVLRHVDPEVEFHPGLLPPGEDTQYLGREGVMDWARNVNDAWEAVTVEPGQRIDIASDRILAIDRWRFEGRDGIQVEEELPTAFTFRDGLIVRVDGFTDKAEALKAAGLSE
jgi:ketosteroid isomerase-like protein